MGAKRKLKFEGLDYCELENHFGIEPAAEGESWKPLKNFLEDTIRGGDQRRLHEVTQDCREYMKALLPNMKKEYLRPFVVGLSQIQHDPTFIEMFKHCVGYLWV